MINQIKSISLIFVFLLFLFTTSCQGAYSSCSGQSNVTTRFKNVYACVRAHHNNVQNLNLVIKINKQQSISSQERLANYKKIDLTDFTRNFRPSILFLHWRAE